MTALIVALLVAGASLFVAEAHVALYGVLGVARVAGLVTGGLVAFVVVAGRKSLEVRRRRAEGRGHEVIGRVGVVRRALVPIGGVVVEGERVARTAVVGRTASSLRCARATTSSWSSWTG
jgi:hypothetical protein